MLKTPIALSITLDAKLNKDDRYLPLSESNEALLVAALPNEGDYTYLTIREPSGAEVVKVTNSCSVFTVDRGEDGTDARTAPRGSCVRWEMTPQQVKDLICNYDCCADGECPCEAVAAGGITVPTGVLNHAWNGSAVFTGDVPMQIAVSGMPAWMKATVYQNSVQLEGTPNVAGKSEITVAATNCDGKLSIQTATLTVNAS